VLNIGRLLKPVGWQCQVRLPKLLSLPATIYATAPVRAPAVAGFEPAERAEAAAPGGVHEATHAAGLGCGGTWTGNGGREK
jgi:hypothetical protein